MCVTKIVLLIHQVGGNRYRARDIENLRRMLYQTSYQTSHLPWYSMQISRVFYLDDTDVLRLATSLNSSNGILIYVFP